MVNKPLIRPAISGGVRGPGGVDHRSPKHGDLQVFCCLNIVTGIFVPWFQWLLVDGDQFYWDVFSGTYELDNKWICNPYK